ncbi:E3 ubiquitin-protein ligase ZSWIM2 isoform X4 [Podarcis muralis]
MGTSLRWPAVFKERRLGSTPLMSRRRLSAPPGLSRRQDQALSGTMRLVRELGPTAFVLQEEEQRAAEHRVFLGNPHSCSCSIFVKEKDLCKHICWLLLKKFKLPRDHEYALQLGLVEREINQVLQGLQVAPQLKLSANSTKELQTADDGYIKQKQIDDEDVCPICQDKLLKRMLPVTYCRFGCGNNIHIVCMKIWADHQIELEKDSLVKCPLCREDFAPLKLILEEFRNSKRLITVAEKQHLDRHLGIPCNNCRVCPIEGNCYKCTECSEYHLCHGCFRRFCHPSHSFAFREFHRKCIDHWLHKENACPIDGHIVYNPLTWENVRSKGEVTPIMSQAKNKFTKQDEQELFIPGTGLLVKQMKPGHVLEKSQSQIQVRCKKKNNSECEESLTQNGFNCTCTRSSASSQHSTQKIRNLKFSRYARGLSLIPKPHADVFTQEAIGTALRGLSVTRNAF